ncbi:hemagglutinin/amebocyte aggregation factor-like [Mytilus trossulus]|uniref:hemagglutinin/amebocyte aggregation factor-like n=1 Tax=Mytilus trossulus TaxID=6551 RepID=UPI003003BD47
MMLVLHILCLICTLNFVVGWEWVNDYDGDMYFECPRGKAISYLYSTHHNRHEDRKWALECRSTGSESHSCYKTPHYVNDWDEFFSFECNNSGFICGMDSIHDNRREDRRFRFQCCSIAGKDLSQCYRTWRNRYDYPDSVRVPNGYVIRGVSSTHDNRKEDRRYSWEVCQLVNRG